MTVEEARKELWEIARLSPGSHMHKLAIAELDKAKHEATK